MSRRKFNLEFKQDAVNLVLEQGLSISQAAADLGIGVSTLDRWLRDFRTRKEDPNKLSPTEFEELKRLRKENRKLRVERDILKKTAVYFVKASDPDTSSSE